MKKLLILLLSAVPVYGLGCVGFNSFDTFNITPDSRVTAPLTNKAVILNGSYGNHLNAAGGMQSASGLDQCFSNLANTVVYPFQINFYSTTSGVREAVQIPTIAANPSTTSFLAWRNKAGVVSDPSSTTVWDSNYKFVLPISDGTSLKLTDVTSNATTCTNHGITAASGAFTMLGAGAFNGSSYLDCGNPSALNITGNIVIEVWFQASSVGSGNRLVSKLSNAPYSGYEVFEDNGNGSPGAFRGVLQLGTGAGGPGLSGAYSDVITLNAWEFFTSKLVSTVAPGEYINGTLNTNLTFGTLFSQTSSAVNMLIGAWPGDNAEFWPGKISEVLIYSGTQTDSWTAAEAANRVNPTGFVNIVSNPATITSFTATPSTVPAGQSTVLAWTTTGTVTTVTITPGLYGAGTYTSTSANGSVPFPMAATTTFSIVATNSNGTTSPSTATATVTAATLDAITPTCAGNSPTSALCTWNTAVSGVATLADSKTTCGGISSPVVDPVKVNTSVFYGVTSHRVAVQGLAASTGYSCTVTSKSASGTTTTSSSVSATTKAPIASIPFIITHVSPPLYYNDQFNGLHGFSANQRGYSGDTYYCSWSDDGNNYCVANDTFGTFNSDGSQCCPNAIGMTKNTPDGLHITMLGNPSGSNSTGGVSNAGNNFPATYTQDGGRAYATGMMSLFGNLYYTSPHYASPGASGNCTIVFKTTDHWASTIGPGSNFGPLSVGKDFSAGVWDYPTTAAGCSSPGTTWNANWIQIGRDYGGSTGQYAPTYSAGDDSYAYFYNYQQDNLALNLNRVTVQDIQLTDPTTAATKYQTFNGTTCADFNDQTKWITFNDQGGTQFPFTSYGMTFTAQWIEPFKRWMGTSWLYQDGQDINQGVAAAIWDLGDCPVYTSGSKIVGQVPMDPLTYTNYYPVFPSVALSSVTNNANGTASFRLTTTGSYKSPNNPPNASRYSPVYFDVTAAPGVAARRNDPRVTYAGSATSHVGNGMDAFWAFNGLTWDGTIPSLAPISVGNPGYPITTSPRTYVTDGQGARFGIANDANFASPVTVKLTTPYAVALGDFTAVACFKTDPNQTPASGATLLDKGTDFRIQHGSSANQWNVVIKGTTVGPVTMNDGAFGCLVIQRGTFHSAGDIVAVYASGIGTTLPPAPSATGQISGAMGTTALTLGALASGSQPFYGTLSEFVVWNRMLSQSELISELSAFRYDMKARIGSPVIP